MSNNGHSNGKIDFAARRKTVTVEVPELETSFRLRSLGIGQTQSLGDGAPSWAEQLALMIVDENGERVYTSPDDIANLSEMSVTAYRILKDAADSLHRVSKKDQEDIAKKSEASLTTDSAFASPAI